MNGFKNSQVVNGTSMDGPDSAQNGRAYVPLSEADYGRNSYAMQNALPESRLQEVGNQSLTADFFGLNHFGIYTGAIGRMPSTYNEHYVTQVPSQTFAKDHFQSIPNNVNGARNERSEKSMKDLEEMFSKLDPSAEEFVPPKIQPHTEMQASSSRNEASKTPENSSTRNSKIKRRPNNNIKNSNVKRTVYVADIDSQVTEEDLAGLFLNCGEVVDCRICGDPNSALRFAFVEFTSEEGATAALKLTGTVIGLHPVKVLPSKTAIVPVNPVYLPRTEDERDLCARTIYCANIDRSVTQSDIRLFFESLCGQVSKLRLLGDQQHNARIAFVEFEEAESAVKALNCSGAILGSLALRISPSKTPVRSRTTKNSSLRHQNEGY